MKSWTILLLAVCGVLVACGGGGTGASDEGLLRDVAQERFARDGYTVTQAEFQDGDGGRWYVIQIGDPAEVTLDEGYESTEGLFDRPMKAYADILGDGELEKMRDVTTFILAYRDDRQSVIEISRGVMSDWVHGRLSLAELRDMVKISSLTG